MIARQIGEYRGMKAHAGAAILIERVRGHFHRHRIEARGAQCGQQPVQRERIGRRDAPAS